MRIFIAFILLAGVVAGGAALYEKYGHPDTTSPFRTTQVERGEVQVTVGATGTVQAEEVVDIGAQVVGRISELGPDPRGETDPAFKGKTVDYGTQVEEGSILALIDKSVYQAQRNQAQAAVDRAKSDLLQLQARARQTEAEWNRAEKLRHLNLGGESPTGSRSSVLSASKIVGITDADYILAKANFDVATANVEVGKSTIAQQASTLELADTNLGYTVIRSPVRGTIIDRRVNIGQTVVASFNAPSLFLIAKDLTRMQVWASVNEADIGKLKVGLPVRFRVDAFPDDTFRGVVAQIRLNATMSQSVVTYTVVVSANNPDLKLLPYLTADLKFEIDSRPDVLKVANAALRYEPPTALIDPAFRTDSPSSEEAGQGPRGESRGGPPRQGPLSNGPAPNGPARGAGEASHKGGDAAHGPKSNERVLWVENGQFVTPIFVKVGLTDGVSTEIISDEIKEGMAVVIGERRANEAPQEKVNNPFAPPPFRRGGSGGRR